MIRPKRDAVDQNSHTRAYIPGTFFSPMSCSLPAFAPSEPCRTSVLFRSLQNARSSFFASSLSGSTRGALQNTHDSCCKHFLQTSYTRSSVSPTRFDPEDMGAQESSSILPPLGQCYIECGRGFGRLAPSTLLALAGASASNGIGGSRGEYAEQPHQSRNGAR